MEPLKRILGNKSHLSQTYWTMMRSTLDHDREQWLCLQPIHQQEELYDRENNYS